MMDIYAKKLVKAEKEIESLRSENKALAEEVAYFNTPLPLIDTEVVSASKYNDDMMQKNREIETLRKEKQDCIDRYNLLQDAYGNALKQRHEWKRRFQDLWKINDDIVVRGDFLKYFPDAKDWIENGE